MNYQDYELPYERVVPQINAYSENNGDEPILPQLL
jgi:hypothetical protein